MPDRPDSIPDFIEELTWRGMLHQCTDLDALRKHLAEADFSAGGRRAYIGFDPTADSLTIGNLVQIMVLAHFQRCGHTPIALLGGATGQIGDPSGKSAERTLSDPAEVARRLERQRRLFERVLRFDGVNGVRMTNNIDWWAPKSYLEVLREIGKHFSVNMMIQKDSVRERLQSREQGISYTEFSYMILQAYDFLHLWKHEGATLQMGGSDQWGNIVAGADLIRRWVSHLNIPEIGKWQSLIADIQERGTPSVRAALSELEEEIAAENHSLGMADFGRDERLAHAIVQDGTAEQRRLLEELQNIHRAFEKRPFGLTVPLLMKADGGKFGKTEKGAIWLTAPDPEQGETAATPGRTTPYALYQYLMNLADADCGKFLRVFTFLSRSDVEDIEARHAADPGQRLAQRTIARAMVAMLHGQHEADAAEAAARALFSGEIAHLPEGTLVEILAEAPASTHARSRLEGDGADLVELLVETALATSKKQAREFLAAHAVTINGQPAPADHRLRPAHLLHGSLIAIRRGKKNWHLTRWE